jgi:altered-inheritance-of-mitochondria protein 5
VTLTTGVLYLTVEMNRQTRLRQSIMLSQQSAVLHSILEPQPPLPPPTAREVRGGFAEMAKDRWNAEIEALLRRAYATDWNRVRADVEDGVRTVVSRLWSKDGGDGPAEMNK